MALTVDSAGSFFYDQVVLALSVESKHCWSWNDEADESDESAKTEEEEVGAHSMKALSTQRENYILKDNSKMRRLTLIGSVAVWSDIFDHICHH